ncbi:MAG: flavodoxin, partial [Nitrospirae bacterium]
MDNKILVAYATKYGATAEIAEKIGQVLRDAGFSVDVMIVHSIKDFDSYDAVVLGSAV